MEKITELDNKKPKHTVKGLTEMITIVERIAARVKKAMDHNNEIIRNKNKQG